MKTMRVVSVAGTVLVWAAGIFFGSTFILRAQTQTQPDSVVQVIADAQGLPLVPPDQIPISGTFWVVSGAQLPAPLPFLPYEYDPTTTPVFSLGAGQFLVDATGGALPQLTARQAQRGTSSSTLLQAQATMVLDLIAQVEEMQAEAAALAAESSPRMMSMMASSLASSYAYGNPVYLDHVTASIAGDGSMIASFGIGGGTNFVPYDIFMTTNLLNPVSSWTWLGIGYTSNNYTFYDQPADLGFYILAKPSKTMAVGFGSDAVGQCDVPYGLTNALQVAGGTGHSLALLNNGMVIAWGWNKYGQATVPTKI